MNELGLHQVGLDPEQGSQPVLENALILETFVSHIEFSLSVFALNVARGSAELIVDPIFLGWRRALRVISYVKATSKILNHRKHLIPSSSWEICKLGEDKWKPNEDETGAEDVLFRYETSLIKTTVKKSILERFLEKDGIIYADGRLSAGFQFKTEDLENVKFIDKHEIMDDIPVVLSDSPILYSYAMYIHTLVNPHSGVESTIKEIHKKMRVLSGLRNLVKSRVISLDVEDVKTTYHDTLRMASKVQIDAPGALLQKKPSKESLVKYGADEYRQIPGKIMVGNGITWMAVISLDMHRNRDGVYFLEQMRVQQGILELLHNFPVSAGLGIRRDVRGIEEFYSLLADEPVELSNGFLDLASLSIAVRYKFHARNMTALGAQVIGTLLNKTVSTGDDMWGLSWSEIPESLCIYGIGDIRFGFMTYIMLAVILLRDLFPDSEIVCWYLKCEQKDAISWFLDWLILSLEGVEFHQDAEARADTREELFCSLRFRDARDKLCQESPKYVKLWTRLLGALPSLTHGGCRYLIQCRKWFLVQIRIMARANIQWTDSRVIRVPTEADLEYARFGLSSDQIGFQSWTEPVTGARGFYRPGSISVPLIDFDPSVVHNTRIGRLCKGIQRFQRWTILEWGRMNPFRLKFFFTRMIRNSGFRIFYKGIYDALRLMSLWIFDEPAPVVIRLEGELNEGVEKIYVEEKNALDKCEIETAIRRDRVSWMEEVRTDWNLKERTRWREGLPQLPVWKRRTKPGTKRSRSRSKSRVGAKVRNVKRRKLNGKKENNSVLVPVQLSSVRNENVIRDETDIVQAGGSVAPEKQGDPAVVFRPRVNGSVGLEKQADPAVISQPGVSGVGIAVKRSEVGDIRS